MNIGPPPAGARPGTLFDTAFQPTVIRPVRLDETQQLVDRATGEIVGWEGLNEDCDRCPSDGCGIDCSRRCLCAPCNCEGCLARTAHASRPVPKPQPKLVLL